jgi:hypothetical protein
MTVLLRSSTSKGITASRFVSYLMCQIALRSGHVVSRFSKTISRRAHDLCPSLLLEDSRQTFQKVSDRSRVPRPDNRFPRLLLY